MSEATTYLDLDAIQPAKVYKLKLNGQEHVLKETTVESFIANTQDIQRLGLVSDAVEELELSIKMVLRSFPTLPEAELRKLTFSQVNALMRFARTQNGETQIEAEMEKEAEANPSQAGR